MNRNLYTDHLVGVGSQGLQVSEVETFETRGALSRKKFAAFGTKLGMLQFLRFCGIRDKGFETPKSFWTTLPQMPQMPQMPQNSFETPPRSCDLK
jgi:hypothetical protein